MSSFDKSTTPLDASVIKSALGGCLTKAMNSGVQMPSLSLVLLTSMMSIIGNAQGQLSPIKLPESLSFDNTTLAIESLALIARSEIGKTSFNIWVDDELVGITDFKIHDSNSSINQSEFGERTLEVSWTEFEVVHQKLHWQRCLPASCAYENSFSIPLNVSLVQAQDYRADWSGSFNLEMGLEATNILGRETAKFVSYSERAHYIVPPHSSGQVWSLQLAVVQDQRSRRCFGTMSKKFEFRCGAWTGKARGYLPIKSGHFFEWCVGRHQTDFESCGRGT